MSGISRSPRLADATIRVDNMPPEGRGTKVVAGEEERSALAEFLELTAVDALTADLAATRFRGGIRVQGRLRATIVQPSVVTLEPVSQRIDEPIDRVFLPGVEDPRVTPGAEVFVDLEADDVPDPLEGPEADMSDLIIETLALAIDPYPRAPGESIADLGEAAGDPPESPFAALRKLRNPPDDEGSA